MSARTVPTVLELAQQDTRLQERWPGLPLERIEVPICPPAGKDLTDFHLAGGDLRSWVRFHLDRYQAEGGPSNP